MEEKKEPAKGRVRLKGIVKIIAKEIEPLNTDEKFKEKFKDTESKVLINAKDGKWAGLVNIDKGTISVEAMTNVPKENIKKKNAGWDGFIEAKTDIFMELLGGEDIAMSTVMKYIVTRKLKVRGIKHILIFLQLFEL